MGGTADAEIGHTTFNAPPRAIPPLYVYWFDLGFVCPWYESFEDALAANPTGAEQDCVFGP